MVAPFVPRPVRLTQASTRHQVGDGFRIVRPFPGSTIDQVDPFLVLDHAPPSYFTPTDTPRGVDVHPHKGMETVTWVFEGALEHRDSTGGYGKLMPDDVQWMTAGAGLVHEEKHERAFAAAGGRLEMVQLWVNLPRSHKNTLPKYQSLASASIPVADPTQGEGAVRVVAGTFGDHTGPAATFTPILLLDVRLEADAMLEVPLSPAYHAAVYLRHGAVEVADGTALQTHQLARFTEVGDGIRLRATAPTGLLVLAGEPIDEPIVSYGPFVMNTWEEIRQAVADYQSGKMGQL